MCFDDDDDDGNDNDGNDDDGNDDDGNDDDDGKDNDECRLRKSCICFIVCVFHPSS